MSDSSDYDEDFATGSHSKHSSRSNSSKSSKASVSSSISSRSSSSNSASSDTKKESEVLHQSKRTTVSKIQEEHTNYRKLDNPDEVEDLDSSGSVSERSVSDNQKLSSRSSSNTGRVKVASAPPGRERKVQDSGVRADSAGNANQNITMLPPLGKQQKTEEEKNRKSVSKSYSPQISPARSDRSRGGVHSSAATLRTSLLDRIDDLKNEIKEIDTRIQKRQRELDRWKSLTINTSQRRQRFVDKLLAENEILEKRLERYDGQVVNVAFLIARTEEQLRRAEARLKEVTKIKRALAARDKRAAHTIEVVHRYMPSAEELETREVNETIYSCASLENKVAHARDTLQRTEESLDLMNRNCERLQREVDRRNISSLSAKAYEALRDTQEEQAKEIQRLKESISIYINAVNAERARVANEGGFTPRDGDTIPNRLRELREKREALQEQVEDVKAAIEARTVKLNTNKQYMQQFLKKREGDDSQNLSAENTPPDSSRRPQESTAGGAKKNAPKDPLELALQSADEATRRIRQEIHQSPKKMSERKSPEKTPDPARTYHIAESRPVPSPGGKAALALEGSKRASLQHDSPPRDFTETNTGPSIPVVEDDDEEGFIEEELEDIDDEEPAAVAKPAQDNKDDTDDESDAESSTPSWLN